MLTKIIEIHTVKMQIVYFSTGQNDLNGEIGIRRPANL